MNFRHIALKKGRATALNAALAAGLILATAGGALAAPDSGWIGAWGFVPTPQPPGMTPATAPNPDVAPLAPSITLPATVAPVRRPLLIDNPGNLPVEVAPARDPANVTVRQLVRVAVAGKRLRLRLTNEGGTDTMVLGAVHVGLAGPDGSVVAGSDHVVTFDGKHAVSVPAGAPLVSDAVDMKVDALQKLVISLYVPGALARGGHSLYQYVAGTPGDQTAQASLPGAAIMRVTSMVSEVEVDPVTAANVVVTLGDSITEGALSTNNAFRGWPDRLAERLNTTAAGRKWAVVNAGIGGNRLLRHGSGPSALARLDRDVLAVPGVKAVILLEGINDIGRGFTTLGPQDPVTADALIAADKQIIERCHAHGIKVFGATLTPYGGAGYSAPGGEQVRQALNTWIKTSGAFDGVVDFAAATADPANPLTFRADYNDYDHLHPNDTGYKAMADAIDLSLITGK
jgi:lysophospholipase L1-like esterase